MDWTGPLKMFVSVWLRLSMSCRQKKDDKPRTSDAREVHIEHCPLQLGSQGAESWQME